MILLRGERMENFFEKFHLNKGTEIYKEDLVKLEELLKDGDISGEYGVNFSDDNYFKYEARYLTNGILSIHSFNTIKDVTAEYENIEIESLDIEKRIYEGSILKQRVIISITNRYLTVSIWADNIQKLKTLKLLIEDFFENRKSKTGKYNNWITEKGHWYSSLLVGSLGGIGLATSNYNFIIAAILTVIIFGVISFPDIKHKIFLLNRISLEKRSEEREEKDSGAIANFLKFGATTIFWGIILYFITNFLSSL